jgi:hypothetical protein
MVRAGLKEQQGTEAYLGSEQQKILEKLKGLRVGLEDRKLLPDRGDWELGSWRLLSLLTWVCSHVGYSYNQGHARRSQQQVLTALRELNNSWGQGVKEA